MTEAAARRERWLFGPVPDLVFGCGLLYVVLFVVQTVSGPAMRAWFPYALAPFLTLLLGTPHYGATLLRVYERREDRRRYALFAVWATALMGILFVVGLRDFAIGSLLVTVYFTWSPWHYSGQNYGIAVLFLRRRKVPIPALAKRFLYGTFVLSYGLVFLSLHGVGEVVQQVPATYQGTVYRFMSLGIPHAIRDFLAVAVGMAYGVCLVGSFVLLRRGARLRELGPSFLLIGIQAIWFLAPAATAWWHGLRGLDPLAPQYRAYAFLWVGTGHFLQYLWICTYYTSASEGTAGRLRYLLKALLAGTAIWTVPALLFAPGALGRLPFDFGLSLLVASVVNLHHFVLDGAIWKLRDGRVARALLRPVEAASEPPERTSRWPARLGWSVGFLVVGTALFGRIETFVGERAWERGELERTRIAANRLAWVGRDSPRVRTAVARRNERNGNLRAAQRELRRSLDIYPTVDAWIVLGSMQERRKDWMEAVRSYEAALALEESNTAALYRLGRVWLGQGEPERAQEVLERAALLAPDVPLIQLALKRARAGQPLPDEPELEPIPVPDPVAEY
jgi:tetratricopeptide (TPR) repeat protein